MKSGNYLSSQQYPASTFGVKELNFCVRNGNRWDLFAIITAMVISIAFRQRIYFFLRSFPRPFPSGFLERFIFVQKTNNYIAKLHFSFSYQPFSLCARKNYRYLLHHSKRFRLLKLSLVSFEIKPSTYQYRSAECVTTLTPPTYQPHSLRGVLPV